MVLAVDISGSMGFSAGGDKRRKQVLKEFPPTVLSLARELVCGSMYTTGWSWHPPTRAWGRQACHAGCLHAVTAALAAVFNPWGSGKGQHVDISLQQAVAPTVEHDVHF